MFSWSGLAGGSGGSGGQNTTSALAAQVQPSPSRRSASSIALGSPPAPVLMDPAQLEQLMLNLVTNAREAILGDGRLRIEVTDHPKLRDLRVPQSGARLRKYRLTIPDPPRPVRGALTPQIHGHRLNQGPLAGASAGQ